MRSVISCFLGVFLLFFFFKQKTAYEMRISDWSSDVCSSDLVGCPRRRDVGDGLALAARQRRRDQHYGSQDVESAHESAPWLGFSYHRAGRSVPWKRRDSPAGRAEPVDALSFLLRRQKERNGPSDRKSTRLNSRHQCASRMP